MKYSSVEEALHILYKGQDNVAVTAAALGMTTKELQTRLSQFIKLRPVDPDIWQRDVEPSWPHIT